MLAVAFAAVAVALPGCAGSDEDAAADLPSPAAVVPTDAFVYVEATIRLRGERAAPARRFISGLTGTPHVAEGMLVELLADAAGADLDFRKDLAPWAGDRAGLFAVATDEDPAAVAAVLPADDERAATRFLRHQLGHGLRTDRYGGVRVWRGPDGRAAAVISGQAVLAGSIAVLRKSIDARDAPLASTPRYKRLVRGRLPFAFAIADGARVRSLLASLADAGGREGRDALALLPRDGDVDVQLDIERNAARVVADGLRPLGKAPEGIGDMPGDAWFAASTGDLATLLTNRAGARVGGVSLQRLLGAVLGAEPPASLVRQLSRGTFYLEGDRSEPSGELVAEVASAKATDRAMLAFARALRRRSGKSVEVFRSHRADLGILTYERGRESADPPLSETFLNGRTLSLVFGPVGAAEKLRDAAIYREAARAMGASPTAVVDMRRLRDFVGAPEPAEGRDRQVKLLGVAEHHDGGRVTWVFGVTLGRVPAKPDA
jgi:Protein of unknown function (DUF3352)